MKSRAFTLVELLVVIAIMAVLAALLFPVFSRAKETAKKATCSSNLRQVAMASRLYVDDNDGEFPVCRRATPRPDVDDAAGDLDEPYYAAFFALIDRYCGGRGPVREVLKSQRLFACPTDADPFGDDCFPINPDAPSMTSYLLNGFFAFGLSESSVQAPASTILLAERRSQAAQGYSPTCDDLYHPWFNPGNAQAPVDDMDPDVGAVAANRHSNRSNFAFADGHVKTLSWGQTYAPPSLNLHALMQP